MPLITQIDLEAIWLDVDPPAAEAFARLTAEHGRAFAESARDHLLYDKWLAFADDAQQVDWGDWHAQRWLRLRNLGHWTPRFYDMPADRDCPFGGDDE
jgi:hypothetical protein